MKKVLFAVLTVIVIVIFGIWFWSDVLCYGYNIPYNRKSVINYCEEKYGEETKIIKTKKIIYGHGMDTPYRYIKYTVKSDEDVYDVLVYLMPDIMDSDTVYFDIRGDNRQFEEIKEGMKNYIINKLNLPEPISYNIADSYFYQSSSHSHILAQYYNSYYDSKSDDVFFARNAQSVEMYFENIDFDENSLSEITTIDTSYNSLKVILYSIESKDMLATIEQKFYTPYSFFSYVHFGDDVKRIYDEKLSEYIEEAVFYGKFDNSSTRRSYYELLHLHK